MNFDEYAHSIVADFVLETNVNFDCHCRIEYLQVPNPSTSSQEKSQQELLEVKLHEQALALT